jgi:hypothetical protein
MKADFGFHLSNFKVKGKKGDIDSEVLASICTLRGKQASKSVRLRHAPANIDTACLHNRLRRNS